MTKTALIYVLAEIVGCFGFWMWLREARPNWWNAPGMASLALFAWLWASRAQNPTVGMRWAPPSVGSGRR